MYIVFIIHIQLYNTSPAPPPVQPPPPVNRRRSSQIRDYVILSLWWQQWHHCRLLAADASMWRCCCLICWIQWLQSFKFQTDSNYHLSRCLIQSSSSQLRAKPRVLTIPFSSSSFVCSPAQQDLWLDEGTCTGCLTGCLYQMRVGLIEDDVWCLTHTEPRGVSPKTPF